MGACGVLNKLLNCIDLGLGFNKQIYKSNGVNVFATIIQLFTQEIIYLKRLHSRPNHHHQRYLKKKKKSHIMRPTQFTRPPSSSSQFSPPRPSSHYNYKPLSFHSPKPPHSSPQPLPPLPPLLPGQQASPSQ